MKEECSLENDAVPRWEYSFPLNQGTFQCQISGLSPCNVPLCLIESSFNIIALKQYHISAIITYGFLELC